MPAGQSTMAAAPGTQPPEDQRRDEILCRMLNTPYRPHQAAPGPGAPEAAPADPAGTERAQD